jgi:hypothetical protein
MSTDNRQQQTAGTRYQPTPEEQNILSKHASKIIAAHAVPHMTAQNEGRDVRPDHPDRLTGMALMMAALKIDDVRFFEGLIKQLANAVSGPERIDEHGLNFMLAVIKNIQPADQTECMLGAQLAAVHMAAMQHATQLRRALTVMEQEAAQRGMNACVRSFAALLEALKRYRSGSNQTVTVQNMSVSDGGQAIVGNITQTPRDTAPKSAPSPSAISDARMSPMPKICEVEPRTNDAERSSS